MHLLKVSLLASTLVLGACSSTSSYRSDYANVTPEMITPEHINQGPVKWSGLIRNTVNHNGNTCFVVVKYKTDSANRPMPTNSGDGPRFFACKKEHIAPKDLNYRLVTVTGPVVSLNSDEQGLVNYPIVKIDDLHLWSWAQVPGVTHPPGFSNPSANVMSNN